MMHPDYEMMIARLKIHRRLRESMKETELRKALARPPNMWARIGPLIRRLVGSANSAGYSARHEAVCLNGGSIQA